MDVASSRVVLITGAASGIGVSIVRAYAARGDHVWFCDIDDTAGQRLEEQLSGQGCSVHYMHADCGMESDLIHFVLAAAKAHGRIDVVVNNVGISANAPLSQMTTDAWDRVMHVNLRSGFILARECLPFFKQSPCPALVLIASTRALMSEPDTLAYSASKGGVVALAHALAASLAPEGVRVNCISPGWIETRNPDGLRPEDHRQHWSGRVGRPEDIAQACLYLTAPENGFVSGHNLVVDGGMTHKMIYVEDD